MVRKGSTGRVRHWASALRVTARRGVTALTAASGRPTTVGTVNSDRSLAYMRLVKTIDDLSGAKLHADEQQLIREAADSLLFCQSLATDAEARRGLDAVETLADRLIENGRMLPETAGRLLADLQSCGPLLPVRANIPLAA